MNQERVAHAFGVLVAEFCGDELLSEVKIPGAMQMSHSDIAITRRITTAEQTEARLAPLGLQKFVIAECEYRTLPSVRYPVAATPPAFWS